MAISKHAQVNSHADLQWNYVRIQSVTLYKALGNSNKETHNPYCGMIRHGLNCLRSARCFCNYYYYY